MVEGFAILAVVAIAFAAYASSWLAAKSHAGKNQAEQLAVLEAHRATLRQKAERGRQENWDHVMLRQVEERLATLEAQIAEKLRTQQV